MKKIYILMILWLLVLVMNLVLEPLYVIVHLVLIVLSILLMSITPTRLGFLLFLATTLIYGFSLTVVAFELGYFDTQQWEMITSHLVLTASLLLTWLLTNEVKSLGVEVKELRLRVKQLARYDEVTQSLSLEEFIERGALIETTLKRRNEPGMLVHFKMDQAIDPTIEKSLHLLFSEQLSKAIRTGYDLVSAPTKQDAVVLLQNTGAIGADIVLGRLRESLKAELNYIELPYSYEVMELDGIREQVQGLEMGSRGVR